MPHPDWTVIWDTDPAEAITTRRLILDRAAVAGLRVTGLHLATVEGSSVRGSGYALV